jgi:hypothetical protein
MRKNGFRTNTEYWRRRYAMTVSNRLSRYEYNVIVPRLLALVNINEITNQSIPKIIWRLQTFHDSRLKKIMNRAISIESWLKFFRGYHVIGVQNKSNDAYARKMTKR